MLSRRSWFAALSALSCSEVDIMDRPRPPVGRPPWHMWGSTKELAANQQVLFSQLRSGETQVARVSYGRPESWRFFLYATVRGPATPVGPDTFINVRFQLLNGVGRSVALLNKSESAEDGFCRMQWVVPAGFTPQLGGAKWTSEVQSPPLLDSVVGSGRSLSVIVGEDIQLSAYVTVENASGISGDYSASVTGFLAPNVHMRPEWAIRQFRGGEQFGE